MVNIKLSDYGISRQSFHEGVLGVEGTPGYQAPEVRPGIVYDEKVQILMFGCSAQRRDGRARARGICQCSN